MRTIRAFRSFRQDRRREGRGRHRATLAADIDAIVQLLRADAPIPREYYDHPLRGRWNGYRECHLRGDLVLIYRKVGDSELWLARLGSHSQLGLA